MKLLSIAVPCYNSEGYMRNCIESLLPGGDEVEIIIVDDGSTKDRTAEIADEYAAKYPGIVKAVHQENGGHGQAVNTGLKHATGLYFKVVDSDDWLDKENYPKVLDKLAELVREGQNVDMMLCNYIYDKQGVKHKKVIRYANVFPQDQVFTWKDAKHFHLGQYILMHSVIYRTQMLKNCGLELPKHTFYVDNIFVYYPLPYVKNLYYMNLDLYHYFIGRSDQSSGYYDDRFFYHADPFRNTGKSGQEKRPVAVPQEEGRRSLLQIIFRHLWPCYEHPWKGREKGFGFRVQACQ